MLHLGVNGQILGKGMSICGIGRWNCEKTLKAYEGGVTAISIGKLALTFGKVLMELLGRTSQQCCQH